MFNSKIKILKTLKTFHKIIEWIGIIPNEKYYYIFILIIVSIFIFDIYILINFYNMGPIRNVYEKFLQNLSKFFGALDTFVVFIFIFTNYLYYSNLKKVFKNLNKIELKLNKYFKIYINHKNIKILIKILFFIPIERVIFYDGYFLFQKNLKPGAFFFIRQISLIWSFCHQLQIFIYLWVLSEYFNKINFYLNNLKSFKINIIHEIQLIERNCWKLYKIFNEINKIYNLSISLNLFCISFHTALILFRENHYQFKIDNHHLIWIVEPITTCFLILFSFQRLQNQVFSNNHEKYLYRVFGY